MCTNARANCTFRNTCAKYTWRSRQTTDHVIMSWCHNAPSRKIAEPSFFRASVFTVTQEKRKTNNKQKPLFSVSVADAWRNSCPTSLKAAGSDWPDCFWCLLKRPSNCRASGLLHSLYCILICSVSHSVMPDYDTVKSDCKYSTFIAYLRGCRAKGQPNLFWKFGEVTLGTKPRCLLKQIPLQK